MTEKLKIIKIIHLVICIGIIITYSLLGNLTSLDLLNFPVIDTSSIVYLFIPLAAFYFSHKLYKSQINSIDRSFEIKDKFQVYQTASLIRLAILEGAAFIILFLKPDFILFGIFIIIYMIYLRPSEYQFKTDIENIRL